MRWWRACGWATTTSAPCGWLEAASRALPRLPSAVRKIVDCQRTREQLLPLVAGYAAAKRAREVIDYGDQVTLVKNKYDAKIAAILTPEKRR